jgi:hypothetical protein
MLSNCIPVCFNVILNNSKCNWILIFPSAANVKCIKYIISQVMSFNLKCKKESLNLLYTPHSKFTCCKLLRCSNRIFHILFHIKLTEAHSY